MEKYLQLSPEGVTYVGQDTLVQFEIHQPRMILKDKNFLVVEISYRRMFLYHLVSTFLPTLSLLAVSLITMYIDESHFEATIMVALTSMLVMYTLFQSHTDSLPQTAYIKMIDIWFLHGLVVPFFVFILEVFTELSHTRGRKTDKREFITSGRIQEKKEMKYVENENYSCSDSKAAIVISTKFGTSDKPNDIDPKNLEEFEDGCRHPKMKECGKTKVLAWIKCCRILIPSFSVVFTLIYSTLAIYQYSN